MLPRPVGFAVAAALLCAAPPSAHAAELIVRRDPGLNAAQRADIRADAGVRFAGALSLPDAEVVTARHPGAALAALNADPDVRYAEPVVRYSALSNDPRYGDQWALENTGQPIGNRGSGTADADMDVPEAWGVSRGDGQTVAIVDTGVDVRHEDLVGQLAAGSRSFLTGTASVDDDSGHGTTVAGVVAAAADNSKGIAGIAPGASILPLKALDKNGAGTSESIGEALDYAGNLGVRVVNASFGGRSDSQYLRDIISAHPQTLYVVPAGNGDDYGDLAIGDDNDAAADGGDRGPEYPCDFPQANLICVGASDWNDVVTDWSNYGAVSVDLFAPGDNIYTTSSVLASGYEFTQGTSLAAPMVAAEAALVLAARPKLTTASLRAVLLSAVDRIPSALGRSVTGGRANANLAVRSSLRDSDDDGLLDSLDDCPLAADPGQADADGDGSGDACDPTPYGPDDDGDGVGALRDRCPSVAGTGADGCPAVVATPSPTPVPPAATPTPPARIVSLGVKVSPRRCKPGHACRKSARVTVKLTRTAKVALRVDRRVRTRGLWVWRRVTSRSLTATASGRSLTVRGARGRSLARGSYRVTAAVTGDGAATHNFKV